MYAVCTDDSFTTPCTKALLTVGYHMVHFMYLPLSFQLRIPQRL
jgi:hypothetical protein